MSKNKKNTILHITPHLGGGVGSVLLNYLIKIKNDALYSHEIVCLDYANENARNIATKEGLILSDNFYKNHDELLFKIADSDIVLVHWWNHPLLYDFLVRETLPPCRVIIWSHISGFNPPYVFVEPLFEYADLFVFTTPVSYEADEIKRLSEKHKEKIRTVWSTRGTEYVAGIKPKPHDGFNVGYIGTVDYCKLHPDFIRMCRGIDIDDAHFIVCGGPMEKEIYGETVKEGIGRKFSFEGRVDNINDYLGIFDVFGYPLAPYHYGTCEQSLAEAMSSGVVPVVLANKTESYMVQDGITGIIAGDENEYIKAVEKLYKDEALRKTLSIQAKKDAEKRFSLDTMITGWKRIFARVLKVPKLPRKWAGQYSGKNVSYFEIFIESLGIYGNVFEEYKTASNKRERNSAEIKIEEIMNSGYSWKSGTRGTVYHYNAFFKDDLLNKVSMFKFNI